ncbi:MAG TPA: 3-methyl-2-oxobutanoate hydroxymethyltransferase, partial [Candidatus Omnitrophota bacterium]|nr:3-methyl-2-oxobutanoate hydroxymethyltransferase [Candidatus Omnitrophota bacterium]
GRQADKAIELVNQAKVLESEGCFALVLECVPDKVAAIVTNSLSIPTIGIGAGVNCDGQVLVTHDMLGLFDRYAPKFVRKYAQLSGDMVRSFEEYKRDVLGEKFPSKKESYSINPDEFSKIKEKDIFRVVQTSNIDLKTNFYRKEN